MTDESQAAVTRAGSDRRKYRRYDGDWTGVWDSGHYVEEVRVSNLSMGGCKIKHSGNILQGQRGSFRLTPYAFVECEVIVHDIMMPETISTLVFLSCTKDAGLEKLLQEVSDE
jgi:hypothetical protein